MDREFSIFAGWFLDGTGDPIREEVRIDVAKGEILRVEDSGRQGTLRLGIDARHCTVLPALIDAHVHLTMSGTLDPQIRRRQLCARFNELREVIARHAMQHLLHGVAAVRDGGDYGAYVLRYKKERRKEEERLIRIATPGKAWRARGRYGKLIGEPPPQGWSLARAVTHSPSDADHVKLVNSGLNSLTRFGKQTPPQFPTGELAAAVTAARLRGKKTMIHANGVRPVAGCIEARCDSVEHGFFMGKENLARLAEHGICWVPTAFTMKAYHEHARPGTEERDCSRRNLESQLEQMYRARNLGVPMVVGSDSGSLGVHHGSSLSEEIALFLEAGFPLEEAVRCATSRPARLLGMETRLGRLVPGMPATLVVVKGPPALLPSSLRCPEYVLIEGKCVVHRGRFTGDSSLSADSEDSTAPLSRLA